MGHGDYPLQEFALRLAEVESRFAKELQAVIECFVQSRVDLPVKHLEDIGKCHSRRAKNLKKAVDTKKTDGVNLWKITNIYSASCVDEDDAMREVRASLRKHIKKEGMKVKMNGEDMNNSYRRVVADDYRPLVSQAPVVNTKGIPSYLTPPRDPSPPLMTEIYDVNGQTTAEEKQRWLEMWRAQVEKEDKEREEISRKLEKRQSMKIFGSTVNIGSIANLQSNISKFFGEKKSNQSASEANLGGIASPNPQRHATDASAGKAQSDPPGSGAWLAPRPVGDDELVMKF